MNKRDCSLTYWRVERGFLAGVYHEHFPITREVFDDLFANPHKIPRFIEYTCVSLFDCSFTAPELDEVNFRTGSYPLLVYFGRVFRSLQELGDFTNNVGELYRDDPTIRAIITGKHARYKTFAETVDLKSEIYFLPYIKKPWKAIELTAEDPDEEFAKLFSQLDTNVTALDLEQRIKRVKGVVSFADFDNPHDVYFDDGKVYVQRDEYDDEYDDLPYDKPLLKMVVGNANFNNLFLTENDKVVEQWHEGGHFDSLTQEGADFLNYITGRRQYSASYYKRLLPRHRK